MGYSSGKLTLPFTLEENVGDVEQAVGHTSGDLETVIKYGNINMWAKYKPVSYANWDTDGQLNSDGTWKSSADWYKANDGRFGLSFTEYSFDMGVNSIINALNSLASSIDGELNGWRYIRPSGGSNSPYRLLDFNRYNANADYPASGVNITDTITAANTTPWTQSMEIRQPAGGDLNNRDYIIPTDITNYSLNIGLAIFKKSGSSYQAMAWATDNDWVGLGIKSSSTSDGASAYETSVVATFKSGGEYYVLPVYFNRSMSQPRNGSSLNGVNGKVVAVPFVGFEKFSCSQAATSQTFGYPDVSNHNVTRFGYYTANFTIDSNGDYYHGGSNRSIRVLIVNSDWDGSYTVNPSSTGSCVLNEVYTVSLGADEKKTIGSCSNLVINLNKTGWKVVFVVEGEQIDRALITPTPIDPTI